MQTYCIILAAGNSIRYDKNSDKLFSRIYGTPLISFTLMNILKVFSRDKIFIVINKNLSSPKRLYLKTFTNNELILGGATRFKSLKNAIKKLKTDANILIHDAARPNIEKSLLAKVKSEIEKKNNELVVPYNPIKDSLKLKRKNKYISVKRSDYISSQTPQAFKLDSKSRKIINNTYDNVADELEIFEKSNLKIKYIEGSDANIKITNKSDLKLIKKLIGHSIKIGNAFDIHKVKKGDYLNLGGVKFKSKYSLVGHSDGDVVIHSIIDVILGALSKKDIGYYFPSSNEKLKNINSAILLQKIYKKFNLQKILILNLDITIISEIIRLEKYKIKIRNNISKLLKCPKSKINIKAKSSDKIGIIGKSKGIACMASILIYE